MISKIVVFYIGEQQGRLKTAAKTRLIFCDDTNCRYERREIQEQAAV